MGKVNRGTRPRQNRIDIWTTDDELKAIDENVAKTRISRSEFLRNLGMGFEPKSAFDLEAIQELRKLRADQGRLGGLLKQCLNPEAEIPRMQAREILQKLETVNQRLEKMILEETLKL